MEPGLIGVVELSFRWLTLELTEEAPFDKEELKITKTKSKTKTKTKTKTANMFCTSERLLNESHGTELTSEEMPLC